MEKHVLPLALALTVAFPVAAADVPQVPAPAQGVSLGGRIGWALPAGNELEGASLSGSFSGALPLQLDLGYRFDRHFSAGFYLGWARGFTKNCPLGETCDGSSTRFGLEAFYTLDQQGKLRPWLGLGVGYEWLRLTEKAGGNTLHATLSGFEWMNLQVGGDFALSQRLWLGPFVLVSFSEFSDADVSAGALGLSGSGSIPSNSRRLHEWIVVGVQGHYEF